MATDRSQYSLLSSLTTDCHRNYRDTWVDTHTYQCDIEHTFLCYLSSLLSVWQFGLLSLDILRLSSTNQPQGAGQEAETTAPEKMRDPMNAGVKRPQKIPFIQTPASLHHPYFLNLPQLHIFNHLYLQQPGIDSFFKLSMHTRHT